MRDKSIDGKRVSLGNKVWRVRDDGVYGGVVLGYGVLGYSEFVVVEWESGEQKHVHPSELYTKESTAISALLDTAKPQLEQLSLLVNQLEARLKELSR